MNWTFFSENWRLIIFIAFAATAFLQIFYYLFFFSRVAFHKTKKNYSSQTHPVSVVICARDEAGNLADNLPGVLVQNYKTTHEVIVVNDNSFDDSKYLLEEFKKTFKQLNVIELIQEAKLIPGKKYPLAVGIKSAKHEIILLTDADCIPASEFWIESMQSAYADEKTEIVLGYSPYRKQKTFLNKLIRWETFHSALQYMSYALAGIPYMGVGRNLSYKKTVFFRHKGFSSHNNIPGGDDDLLVNAAATRKNTKVNLNPDSFVWSKPVHSWQQWMNQKNRHYSTSRYYKLGHKILLGIYSLSNFLFYPLMILSCIFFGWKISLIVFGIKFLIQMIVYAFALKKLNEKDLLPYVLLLDIWMFFYYLIFAPALIRKAKPSWK